MIKPPPELLPFLDVIAELIADQMSADGVTVGQIRTVATNSCKAPRTPSARLRDTIEHFKNSQAALRTRDD